MKRSTLIYAGAVSVVGAAAGIFCAISFFRGLDAAGLNRTLVLAVLLVLCRSMPLYVRDDCAIDMSFISILTIFLLEGPIAAAALYLVTTPFVVMIERQPGGERVCAHIFNTPFIKTAFNMSNLVLSILIGGGACCFLFGFHAGDISLPGCIPSIFVYVILSMLVNTMLIAVLLHFEAGAGLASTLLVGFGQFGPNILCAAPLGYFLALLLQMDKGIFLAALFMLPLLLARFSFKLYVGEKRQQYKIVQALSAAIEAKDIYTVGHSQRVEKYSELLAHRLHLRGGRIETLKTAALFHDIGKIGIHDEVLQKRGPLTDAERALVQQHPLISVHILEEIDFYGDIKQSILCHHERWDGKGYPNGKRGREIPLEASIIAVADAFDAMTSDRPYRRGFSTEKAISVIAEESGRQFCPEVAKAMLSLYGDGMLEGIRPAQTKC
ncbi:MAG: HD-GYP domain-containing protein [Oscillospiraceae bacterium]|nr:HD-GYP domain-containing protein [Oscillospiraceae bacterium]